MGKCILIIGGARSGKSAFALDICKGISKKRIFLATAQPIDNEMKKKIKEHKKMRGPEWITVEEPINISEKIKELDSEDTVILLDCLTVWINNLFIYKKNVEKEINHLIKTISYVKGTIVIISNEVGMGIVPNNELSRKYRELLGYANQKIASLANKVIFMVAGIPLVIKSDSPSKNSLLS